MKDYRKNPPAEGWDENRIPFWGKNKDWTNQKASYNNRARTVKTLEKARSKSFFRSPEGSQTWSQAEMDKFCTCKSYQKGVQADALFCLNAASDWYRDTLRVKDEHEGDSVVGTDDDDDDASRASVILYHEDGRPDIAHIPAPWTLCETLWNNEPG